MLQVLQVLQWFDSITEITEHTQVGNAFRACKRFFFGMHHNVFC